MFERFTHESRRAIVLAQEEARLLSHNYIGTEHLLLGLIADPEGKASRVLGSLNITLEGAREEVRQITGVGQEPARGHIPFTPRAKKVLELSLREALTLRSQSINSEHLLLGLIAEGEGVGVQVLIRLGASLATIRERVTELPVTDPEPTTGEVPSLGRQSRVVRVEGLGVIQELLQSIDQRLTAIERHLTSIERRLGIAPEANQPAAEGEGPATSTDPATGTEPAAEGESGGAAE